MDADKESRAYIRLGVMMDANDGHNYHLLNGYNYKSFTANLSNDCWRDKQWLSVTVEGTD